MLDTISLSQSLQNCMTHSLRSLFDTYTPLVVHRIRCEVRSNSRCFTERSKITASPHPPRPQTSSVQSWQQRHPHSVDTTMKTSTLSLSRKRMRTSPPSSAPTTVASTGKTLKQSSESRTSHNQVDQLLNNLSHRQLTKTLLKTSFNLTLSLPSDRLCPPVPVRWNYIRWLQDLLATTNSTYSDTHSPQRSVLGLDIGVGASCIYSLLACASSPGWRMLGSDVDQHSLDYARRNVEANDLQNRIKLALTATDSPLLPLDKMGVKELDFCMCNPPFYSSSSDMAAAYGSKAMPPSAVCTGSENEMICPGGDVGFVTRILEESLVLRSRVQWYTSMLGRLASVHQIISKLKEHNITNFAVTNLKAGQKTRRWAVAWSFQDFRPGNEVARHGELVQAILPFTTEWTIALPGLSGNEAAEKVNATMKDLSLKWHWRRELNAGIAFAKENVWSRAARRKRKFEQQHKSDVADDASEDEEQEVAIAIKITCRDQEVHIRWLRGQDLTLWESFCGMLKRALGARDKAKGKDVSMEE